MTDPPTKAERLAAAKVELEKAYQLRKAAHLDFVSVYQADIATWNALAEADRRYMEAEKRLQAIEAEP